MASEDRPSAFVQPLPARPSLEMQQKRAKSLLRAAATGDPDALQRIRALHPKPPSPDALKLAGERVRPEYLPTGLDDVDAVLRGHRDRRTLGAG